MGNIYIYDRLMLWYNYIGDTMVLHYPRLDTVLNVEKLIRKADEPLSKNEIDRRLEKKIMRPTLNVILAYLESSGKIARSNLGIIWIYDEDSSPRLKEIIKNSVRVR